MKRKDPFGNELLTRMHYKHRAYYYVHRNQWVKLAEEYPQALTAYGRLVAPADGLTALLDKVYTRYQRRYEDGDLALATWNQYKGVRKRIESAFVNFTPREVIQSDITTFLYHYEDTPNMANRMLTVLKAAFELGVRLGRCETNPAHAVKRFPERKRTRYLTHAEYRAIRAKANRHTQIIMDLCYLTAQRIGDILRIEYKDIQGEELLFEQGKTGKRLAVRITPEIRRALNAARGLHKVTTLSPYLFHPAGKSTPYAYRSIRDNYERARAASGVPNTTIHDLRAKALTDAKKAGLDAQRLAGHESEGMTRRYLRLRETDAVEGPKLEEVMHGC